jgi:hypothetical protein
MIQSQLIPNVGWPTRPRVLQKQIKAIKPKKPSRKNKPKLSPEAKAIYNSTVVNQPRRDAVIAYVKEHPGCKVNDLAEICGSRYLAHSVTKCLIEKKTLTKVLLHACYRGRTVKTLYVDPPGTYIPIWQETISNIRDQRTVTKLMIKEAMQDEIDALRKDNDALKERAGL